MHHVSSLLGKVVVSSIFVLFAQSTWAVVKIQGVTNVSNSKDLTPTTTTTTTTTAKEPAIFGGIAGSETGGDATISGTCANRIAGATCNSCENNGATDDTRFIPCNPSRIYPELEVTFTISSDKVETAGIVYLTSDDGDTDVDRVSSSTDLKKNQNGTITVKWLKLCQAIGAGDCDTPASGELRLGVSTESDENLTDAGDDYISINVHVLGDSTATQTTHSECTDGNNGICQFDVAPGDGKVKLQMLESIGTFPVTPDNADISYKNVLLYFAKEADGGFAAITPVSDYYSLSITENEDEDDTTFSLDSEIADGLENETLYFFKVALQDEAMNIGYFTPDVGTGTGVSVACADTTPTTYTPPCHTARPGEVLGILSKDVNCFIATAAWGSPMASQVNTFREFRNAYLLPYKWGRVFVKTYYKYGKIAAGYIARSDIARAGVRVALTPLLGFAWLSMRIGVMGAILITLLLIASPIAFLKLRVVRSSPRRNDT